jgi:polysaccharide biosynthesis transport protein
MTVTQYLRIIRAHWLIVLLATALGAIGAMTVALLQTPVYSATAELFVSTGGNNSDINTLIQGSSFTQQRVKSYADVVTSPRVLQPVIDGLHLPYTRVSDLGRHVTASSPIDTVLLDVKVTDTSATHARDIANAIANQFSKYVTELEQQPGPNGQPGTSPVRATVTTPAETPEAPDSPKKSLDLAIGLLIGLGLGIGVAVLRDSMDHTLGERHDPAEVSGAPVLTGIGDDPDVTKAPLITQAPFSPRAEAFRQLRTNIRYLSVDQEVRSLVVSSAVSGEGKTAVATNLAIAMAQSGERVVLVDADLRRPSIAERFGLPNGIGLSSVLVGDASLEQALQPWRQDLPLYVLTSGPLPPNPSELIGSRRMYELVVSLTKGGYVVVVDSPPLLPVTDAAVLARLTQGALVVTQIGSTKVEQLKGAVEALHIAGAPILGVVANRVPGDNRSVYESSAQRYIYAAVGDPRTGNVYAGSHSAAGPEGARGDNGYAADWAGAGAGGNGGRRSAPQQAGQGQPTGYDNPFPPSISAQTRSGRRS